MRQEKGMKGINIRRKKKCYLQTTWLSIERIPKISSKMLLELMKEFNKAAGIKAIHNDQLYFPILAINAEILIPKKYNLQ